MKNSGKIKVVVLQKDWKNHLFSHDDFDDDFDSEKTDQIPYEDIFSDDDFWKDEIHDVWDFEEKPNKTKKLEKSNNKVEKSKPSINDIDISWKKITWINWEYFDTKDNYWIHDWKLIITKWKLIIKKIKKTIQYFIEIEKWEIEIANNKKVPLDNQKFIYNKWKKEFISENSNYNFDSLDIDLWKKTFSLNEWKILISDTKKSLEKEKWLIWKVKDKVALLLWKKNK